MLTAKQIDDLPLGFHTTSLLRSKFPNQVGSGRTSRKSTKFKHHNQQVVRINQTLPSGKTILRLQPVEGNTLKGFKGCKRRSQTDIMKEKVTKFVEYYKCTTAYSGKDKTMYIKGDEAKEAVKAVKANFTLDFGVVEG